MPVETLTEYITINGNEDAKFEAVNVFTEINAISFTIQGDAAWLRSTFKEATSLKVYPDTKPETEAYGIYPDVSFESNTEMEDDNVRIKMHILTEAEKEMKALKQQVNDHEEILADLMFGGEA